MEMGALLRFAMLTATLVAPMVGAGILDLAPPSGLQPGFYTTTCPLVENIVRDTVQAAFTNQSFIPAAILRAVFHDCFVRGCDASLLLDDVNGVPAEKHGRGVNLRGLEVFDDIKTSVEAACPGVVSCADIINFAARDATVLTGGPFYIVEAGRRDGLVSLGKEAGPPNLPVSFFNVTSMTALFAAKGFTQEELVILSGGHTLGGARCNTFYNRLGATPDPTMDPAFRAKLLNLCVPINNPVTEVDMDDTGTTFDNSYFKDLVASRGLLTSDQTLYTDSQTTADIVTAFASVEGLFFERWVQTMIKLGRVDVLTGTDGQIRANCRVINPVNAT